MLIDRAGTFKASFTSRVVNNTGKNSLLTFVAGFQLVQEMINSEWEPVDGDYDITGYFYLVCKDGTLNEITMDNLKKATGWTGGDPFWLDTEDLSTIWVQLKIEFETYEGKTRPRIKYINHVDSTGVGVEPASDKERKAIMAQFGAKFRATAGGTPRPAPAPKAGTKPTTAAPAKKSEPVPAADPVPDGISKDEAWAKFSGMFGKKTTEKHIESEWTRCLNLQLPGKEDEQITPVEWATFCVNAKSNIVPF